MWIESSIDRRDVMLKLYHSFSDSLSGEGKKKLERVKKYCSNGKLMNLFIECYYKDLTAGYAAEKVMSQSKTRYANNENWRSIIESYQMFRSRFQLNWNFQEEIVNSNYLSVHDEVLSRFDSSLDLKQEYIWWEESLNKSENQDVLKAWKELHMAHKPEKLKKFWEIIPKIISAQSIKEIDKMLEDNGFVFILNGKNWQIWRASAVRDRIYKIIKYYKIRYPSRIKEQETKRNLLLAMEWAMNHYGGNDDNIVDEDGNVVPNSQKLNRWEYWGELQDKEYFRTEKQEDGEMQSEQDPKVKDQPKQLKLFAEEVSERKSGKSQQFSKKPQQEVGEKQLVADSPVIRALEIDRDDGDDDSSIPSWHSWTDI